MTTTLNAGSVLQGGRYKILNTLGQGGFGITYLGVQSGLERKVAIKEFYMKEYCARDAENSRVTIGTEGARQMVERFRTKFLNEARKLAQLNHAHIVRVIDVFQENDTAYYVMEYADGGSLSQVVKSQGPLPQPLAVRYAKEIGSALQYIHEQRMNHLDIKPGNVMLNEKGETVIIDFGMSKHYDAATGNETSTTPVGISDGYAPMEQYRPGGVGEFSPQTDIYALGATLYFLLTAQKPPTASDVNEDGLPIEPLKSVGVDDNIITVITKAMEPRKRDRYATASAFLGELESVDNVTVAVVDDDATVLKLSEETGRKEAERKAREEAARKEAERKAREEAARKEAERQESATPVQPLADGGKSKLWIGIAVVAVVVIGAAIGFGTKSSSDDSSTEIADTTVVEKKAAAEKVENKSILLDHGHATKRSFVYNGEVNGEGIPEGQGSAVYPETKDCSSCTFEGTFVNGIPSEGDLVFAKGSKYHGTFDSEGFYKEGKLTDGEGYVFEGTFKAGKTYNGTWYKPTGEVDYKVVNGVDQ